MRTTLLAAAALCALALPATGQARPMTVQNLATMDRLGSPAASPDGRWVAYVVTTTDYQSNKRTPGLYLLDLSSPAAAPRRIADLPGAGEHDPAFGPDGALYFISGKSGSDQIWRVALPGGTPAQVSDLKADVAGFKISPDGRRVVLWGDVGRNCPSFGGCKQDGDRTHPGPGTGRVYDSDDGFVRHWAEWSTPGKYSRAFAFDLANGVVSGPGRPLDGSVVGDTPVKPFGGGEQINWSADSRTVYTTIRLAGRTEPRSTNLDIYASPVATGQPVNITQANLATDTLPTPSPDGRWLAYVAMQRPGYESDRQVLMLRNLATGQTHALTQSWDRSVGSIAWAPDGRSIYVTAEEILDDPLFRIDVASGKVERLTKEGSVGDVVPLSDGSVVYTLNSLNAPNDLYRWRAGAGSRQLTSVNAELLRTVDPVKVDRFSFAGANGDRVYGIIVKPTGAAAQRLVNGKLPIAFVVHGGPQGSFGEGWSYRWNPKVMASQGYAVVSVDFHGSTGYGQAFQDAINRDWGGKPLEDLKLGLAAAAKRDRGIDPANSCALGASYGGYMMNWIEGNWPDQFKCIVQHDGVFDARAMAYETDELWFDEWEHGGHAYYEAPAEFERWNPVNYVARWKTPMLVVTSENDFRIPYTQGLAAFTALQRRGIPARLLVFPDESHFVLKPKNSVQWHNVVFDWLDRWLRRGGAATAGR